MTYKRIIILAVLLSMAITTYFKLNNTNNSYIDEGRPMNDFLDNGEILESNTRFESNDDLNLYDITYDMKQEEIDKIKKLEKEKQDLAISVQGQYRYNPPNNELFRLASHEDSKETIVNKINSFVSGSPISGFGEYVYNVGVAYNIDPYFIVAVANQESSLGKHTTSVAKYNMFGIKSSSSPNGWRIFEDRKESISYFAYLISKYYLDQRGFTTIEQIGETYCPKQGWPPAIRRNLKLITG